jgi:glycosyltransferase involved in cell wall biosynthesis
MNQSHQNDNLPLVSIIVPVYNTARYLNKCVDSILAQTYTQLQIILVNDGSTDQSREVCLALCNMDERCQYVEQANGGLSAARNTGLQFARGEYLSFVDSDDYVAPQFIESLLMACILNFSLVSSCGRVVVYENGEEKMFTYDAIQNWEGSELLERFLLWDGLDGSVCDKLFHNSLLPLLHFSPGRISEDLPILAAVLIKARRMVNVGAAMYFYVQRGNSITNHGFSSAKLSVLDSSAEVRQMIKQAYPTLAQKADVYHWHHLMLLRDMLIGQEIKHGFSCQRLNFELKKELRAFLSSPLIEVKQKLKTLILLYVPLLYRLKKSLRSNKSDTFYGSSTILKHK